MKTNLKKPTLYLTLATVAVALALTSTTSHAALLSVDYLTNGDGLLTRDTATGLEWLEITLTYNRNYLDIQSLTDSGGAYDGFRRASEAEYSMLLANAGLPTAFDDFLEFTDPALIGAARELQSLLGHRLYNEYDFVSGTFNSVYDMSAYYSDGLGSVRVYDRPNEQDDNLTILNDWVGSGEFGRRHSSIGYFLVRSSPANTVPDSGNMAMMLGGGLMCLVAAGRSRFTRLNESKEEASLC